MIIVGDKLVSEDILEHEFICNLKACMGACCIEGDSGAPVTAEEKAQIEKEYEQIKPYLSAPSIKDIANRSGFEIDDDNEWVTTCLPGGECNFVVRDKDGILKCGIENAYLDGQVSIRKPSSCYLYPIRVIKVGDYLALNYHRWDICKAACTLGHQKKTAIYKFLREPLIASFGLEWYEELEAVAEAYFEEKNQK